VTRAYEFIDLESTDLCDVIQDVCGTDGHDCHSWFNQTELSLLCRSAGELDLSCRVRLSINPRRHSSRPAAARIDEMAQDPNTRSGDVVL
jgi:hypothetical protein